MKFKAHIKLTEEQSQDAVRYGAEDAEYADVEFTLFDLACGAVSRDVPYSFRELLIPWLLAGNQPEVILSDEELIYAKRIYPSDSVQDIIELHENIAVGYHKEKCDEKIS